MQGQEKVAVYGTHRGGTWSGVGFCWPSEEGEVEGPGKNRTSEVDGGQTGVHRHRRSLGPCQNLLALLGAAGVQLAWVAWRHRSFTSQAEVSSSVKSSLEMKSQLRSCASSPPPSARSPRASLTRNQRSAVAVRIEEGINKRKLADTLVVFQVFRWHFIHLSIFSIRVYMHILHQMLCWQEVRDFSSLEVLGLCRWSDHFSCFNNRGTICKA